MSDTMETGVTRRRRLAGLVSWIAASLGMMACPSPNNEACQESCPAFGIDDAARCEELCTRPCGELARTYGIDEARCREIQASEHARP